jgi:two-component system, chemotaxis family, protein-glutamate methylesterase/glutaminase
MILRRERPTRAIVVENDSPQRTELLQALQRDGDIAVLGLASTTAEAIKLVSQVRPDVVIVDLHLGDGGGKPAIEQVMRRHPTPILVLSAGTEDRQSSSAIEALLAGALDALPRPGQWTPELATALRRSVHQISRVAVLRHARRGPTETTLTGPPVRNGGPPIVAIAASTGGPSALAVLLAGLAGLPAPVLVVQHLHRDFTGGLLDWMQRVSALPVVMAAQDQISRPGRVYVAPGGVHLTVGANRRLELHDLPASLHRPSADQLFQSVAQFGASGIGVILTGMGDDGAAGLLAMRRSGAQTFGQDEASCAVFGMPKAAHRLGAVVTLLPLDQLADAVQRAERQIRA